MAFSFGFSGDDIDIDDTEINNESPVVPAPQGMSNSLPELVKASKHDMDEWVSLFGNSSVICIFVCNSSWWIFNMFLKMSLKDV